MVEVFIVGALVSLTSTSEADISLSPASPVFHWTIPFEHRVGGLLRYGCNPLRENVDWSYLIVYGGLQIPRLGTSGEPFPLPYGIVIVGFEVISREKDLGARVRQA